MKICECPTRTRTPRVDNRDHCAVCGNWIGWRRPATREQLHQRIVHLKRIIDHLEDSYRWAYNTVHTAATGERLEGRSNKISNPTAALVTGDNHRRARTLLAVADQLVDRATRQLLDAAQAVGAALELVEPDKTGDHTPAPFHDPESFPTVARRREIAQSHAAQQRRHSRGDGWGDA